MIEKDILHYIVVKDKSADTYYIHLYEKRREQLPIFQSIVTRDELTRYLKEYSAKGDFADHIDI